MEAEGEGAYDDVDAALLVRVHAGVLERGDDARVRIVQLDVLAHQRDAHLTPSALVAAQ